MVTIKETSTDRGPKKELNFLHGTVAAFYVHSVHHEDGLPIARVINNPKGMDTLLHSSNLRGKLLERFEAQSKADQSSKLKGYFARQTEIGVQIVAVSFVGDGLGGSGSRLCNKKGDTVSYSQARIAAETASKAINSLADTNPQVFSRSIEEIQAAAESALTTEFGLMNSLYETKPSAIKGKIVRDYPTTCMVSIIQEDEKNALRKIHMLGQGDSSTLILTPTRIYTTAEEGAGDAPMDGVVDLNNHKLLKATVSLPIDEPVIVVTATDAFLKLDRNSIQGFINFIMKCLNQVNSVEQLDEILKREYAKTLAENAWLGAEPDDATISLSVYLPNGTSLKDFKVTAPIQHIALA